MKNLVRTLSILIYFMLPFRGQAIDHVYDWLSAGTTLRYRINLDKQQFEKEIAIDVWQNMGPIVLAESDRNFLMTKYSHAEYFILSNQKVRFVIQGTGVVLDFDLRTRTLQRIDRTLHSGYNFSSIRFKRENTIYSIGGEGFWSYNRHITYFDDKTSKEWELYRPQNKGPEHISDGFQGYAPKQDIFYSGGSNNKNFLEEEKITFEKAFYQFSFKTKTWEYLGEISKIIPLAEHRTIFWNGTHFVQLARDRIYIIEPQKNEVYEYKNNATYFEAGGDHYISGDTIHYFHFSHRGPLTSIPVLSLIKQAKFLGKFYEKDYSIYYFAGMGMLLFLGVILFFLFFKKRKLGPTFEPLERKLLLALYTAKDDTVPTNELNEILECGSKSQENQRRIRYITIKQVNEKLAYYYNIKNAIERNTSKEDKRLITYRLKKGIREKIKSIL